ncbi:MAG: methyltransferase domain-containing protein [Cyclobacteriaceae bacterium]|nr:methyltransferase domain-containing protein [Cyclobacteriaceae bacterium]
MFTPNDIAYYYNTTLNHYEWWWNLRKSLSVHYGIWENGINSFAESLVNTNRVLAELSAISENDHVLDAGCGVGGSAIYLASTQHARVTGITLSQKQVDYATATAQKRELHNQVSFQIMDYTKTSFENESFDIIWACESVCHAKDKSEFIREAWRLLKKEGRLIMSDYFLTNESQQDKNNWVKKWQKTWGMNDLVTNEYFVHELQNAGFTVKENLDYTDKVRKSARRLYNATILGALPSELYNLTHPNVTRFAKTHYRSGYYQWKALKEGLWRYGIIFAAKT